MHPPQLCAHSMYNSLPNSRQLLFECIFAAFSNLARLNKPYVFWSNLSLTSSESLDGKTRSTNFKQFFMGPSRMRRTIYYTLLLISNFTSHRLLVNSQTFNNLSSNSGKYFSLFKGILYENSMAFNVKGPRGICELTSDFNDSL